MGREWASRVFYSDNGSTAVEVGIKMAFRKFVVDNDLARLAGGAGDTPFPTLKVNEDENTSVNRYAISLKRAEGLCSL